MKLSAAGRAFIQRLESLQLEAYPDAKGYSIGYGHFGVKKGDVITKDEALRLFDVDVARFEQGVSVRCPVALQHEFDAMVSLAYNVGVAGFVGSTVARQHLAGLKEAAADAFLWWNRSQGRVLPALQTRRSLERNLYLTGRYDRGEPPKKVKDTCIKE